VGHGAADGSMHLDWGIQALEAEAESTAGKLQSGKVAGR